MWSAWIYTYDGAPLARVQSGFATDDEAFAFLEQNHFDGARFGVVREETDEDEGPDRFGMMILTIAEMVRDWDNSMDVTGVYTLENIKKYLIEQGVLQEVAK